MSRRTFEEKAISREDLLLDEFMNLAIHRFKWNNLPRGLNTQILEEMLITYGTLGAFKDDNGLVLILPLYGTNKINIYGEEIQYTLNGRNGSTFTKDIDEIVKLKNNQLGTEDLSTLQLYAKKIDDIEQTQDVNLFQQQIPKIIGTSKEGVLTAKNIIKQIKEQRFVIFTKSKGIEQQIKREEVLDNTAPYLLDKLADYEQFYRNKVLTFLGINNNNVNKKERLIVDEVNANNDFIQVNLDLMFDMRKQFCDEVNQKFGLNISVEKRKVEDVHINNTEDSGE